MASEWAGASCFDRQRLEFDVKAEFGELPDEAIGFDLIGTAIEMIGAEVFVHCAIFHHVVDGREHRGGNRARSLLRTTPALEAKELRPEVAFLRTASRPGALDKQGLEPGAPLRRREDLRLPALSLLPGQSPAHDI